MRPHLLFKILTIAMATAFGVLSGGCQTPEFGFNDQVTNPMRITGFNLPSTGSVGVSVPFSVNYLGKEASPRLHVSSPSRDEIATGRAAVGSSGEYYVKVQVATTSTRQLPRDAFKEPGIINGTFTPPATGTFLFVQRSVTPDYQDASASIEILP